MLEGTAPYFSAGCIVFILLAAFAFNAGGGLTRTAGAYVFCYSLLVFIIGVSYKAFLGEPAQSNLASPRTDIEAYVATIAAMYGAVVISGRFRRKSGLLQNLLKPGDAYRASVGCILFGAIGGSAIQFLGPTLQSIFAQLNDLIPLGIIIGVMYEIRRSGGERSTNLPIVLGAAYGIFLGMTGFSKQGIITPVFCWALPICALRYRLSAVQILSAALAILLLFYYLVPYAQYGRGFIPEEGATLSQRVAIATPLLEHPEQTRKAYQEEQAAQADYKGLSAYFNTPQGFWERLQFISVDDKLITYTENVKTFGLLPIYYGFINVIPHFIWPNKPGINIGNTYVHELNGETLGEGDTSTGIAFSPTAEAFHLAKWPGIFIVAPLLWCILFIMFDALLGDLRTTPWGLLAFALISHIAPEGGIVGVINLFTLGAEVLTFCAFFSSWFAPLVATLIVGPSRPATRPGQMVQAPVPDAPS
jgi:hypothetical protein